MRLPIIRSLNPGQSREAGARPSRLALRVRGTLSTMGSFGRIVRRFWPQIRPHWLPLTIAVLAMLVEIGLRLLEPWPLKFVFDYLIPTGASAPTLIPALEGLSPTALLTLAALAVVTTTGLRAGASYLSTVNLALVGNRVLTEVRGDLYRHLLKLSLSYHTRARGGDLLTRVIGDVGRLQEVAITALFPLLVHLLTLLGMLALMVWIQWQLALVTLLALPLVSLSMVRLSRRIREVARTQRKREGALAAVTAESLNAIKVIHTFSLEKTVAKVFIKQNSKNEKESVKGARLAARMGRTVDALLAASTALVLWYGARLVLTGSLTPGDLLVFMSYLKGAFKPMRDLAKYTGRLAKATAAGERVLDVLDTEPDIRDLPGARVAPRFVGALSFEHVSFAYEPEQPTLRDVSFELSPGQSVALVGPSGGGKSSLVSLLLRLYQPQRGNILIDGHYVHAYTLDSVRAQMSVVLQDAVLFAVSVRDNIAYGLPGARDDAIEAAARRANAHEFIMALPNGYDTILGERGATLSGGERQRIAIARAMLRGAPIVILDEPTTGLDKENERAVREALDELTEGCTTLLITHDLRAARPADLILYLEQGRVVERGTHDQLIRLGGRYAAMYALQLLSYESEA
ncbi:MAG: ABC transporter ATP-binding protein [Ardenticatenaceae bacterium]